MAFAYTVGKPTVDYSLFDKNRKLKFNTQLPLTNSTMIHEFLATENFIIIPGLPLEANPRDAIKEKRFMFKYQPDSVCRYGIFSRNEPHPDKGQWFEMP